MESPEKVGVALRKTRVGVWLEQWYHIILEMMKTTKTTENKIKQNKTPKLAFGDCFLRGSQAAVLTLQIN